MLSVAVCSVTTRLSFDTVVDKVLVRCKRDC